MATEYKLSYAAKDIDNKLSTIETSPNLIPYPYQDFTPIDGLDIIDNGNGSLNIRGTLIGTPDNLLISSLVLDPGTYTINPNTTNSSIGLYVVFSGDSFSTTTVKTFTISERTLVSIYLDITVTWTEGTFFDEEFIIEESVIKPQLEVGESSSEWKPFISTITNYVDSRFNNIKNKLNSIELAEGRSAYEVAKKNGFEGTETEWLESLQGEDGQSGVYVGSGDPPEGYNVQIDPEGETYTLEDLVEPAADAVFNRIQNGFVLKDTITGQYHRVFLANGLLTMEETSI